MNPEDTPVSPPESPQSNKVTQENASEDSESTTKLVTEDSYDYDSYMSSLIRNIATNIEREDSNRYRRLQMAHPWHGAKIGTSSPDIVNAIIEIPAYSRVKTELDLPTGLLRADRILHSSVIYPANYGFVPETLAGDKNPLDILVLCQLTVPPLSIVKARPIGVIPLSNDGQIDNKIIAVAVGDPEYNIYFDISELPPFQLMIIDQFLNDYKKLERITVKTFKPLGAGHAKRMILEYTSKYRINFKC